MAQTSSPSVFTTFFRWLRLKNYQYEVTFSLYMLTPIEKLVFNTLLIFLISMFLTAAYVYLPNHVITICSHVWYYWAGDALSEQLHSPLHAASRSDTVNLGAATGSPTDATTMAAATARKIVEL